MARLDRPSITIDFRVEAPRLDDLIRRLRVLAREHDPVEDWLVQDPPTWDFKPYSSFRRSIFDWRYDR